MYEYALKFQTVLSYFQNGDKLNVIHRDIKNANVIVVAFGMIPPGTEPLMAWDGPWQILTLILYKVIMRIIDQYGSAPIVFFNTMVNKLSGHTAWELMERHGMDVDDYWPSELLELVGKRLLFKIYFSDYNVNNNNHTYMCDAVNDEPEFIKHFKDGFLEDEDTDDEFTTPADKIKMNNFTQLPSQSCDVGASGSGSVSGTLIKSFNDSSLNRVLMSTPSSETEGSGSGSKRVFIDLDDIGSDVEGEGGSSGSVPKVVRVKD